MRAPASKAAAARDQATSLRARAILWSALAALAGAVSVWLWMTSQANWQSHLDRAFLGGIALYDSLASGAAPPPGAALVPTDPVTDTPLRFEGAQPAARVTYITLLQPDQRAISGDRLALHITSPDIAYPVAAITARAGHSAQAGMGDVARILASYCSDPEVHARLGDQGWRRIEAPGLWSCAAHPADLRLWAVLGALLAAALLVTMISDTAASFTHFAEALKTRRRGGGPLAYDAHGPQELRDTVAAVNDHLALERERLEKRLMVVSGVSHDLGTPATRLRLRTALIDDAELRGKLDADIDRMTEMIESVLTFTQAEMDTEAPRALSLTSLVESIVADYDDIGQPVTLAAFAPAELDRSQTIFGGRSGAIRVGEARRLLVHAQPMALRRAISNLIDNALKYGRRATVALTADADTATIEVTDEGTGLSDEDINALTAPFTRGENAENHPGLGLGLTIVSTIARQHGGNLRFDRGPVGLRAQLVIARR